jgi:hypothetical protein
VFEQSSTPDIQGTGNSQYKQAMAYIDGSGTIDAASLQKLKDVAQASEAAYAGDSDDSTGGGTFWSHDAKNARPKASKACGLTETTSVDGAQFYKCSQ